MLGFSLHSILGVKFGFILVLRSSSNICAELSYKHALEHPEAAGPEKNAYLLLTSLKACDRSGYIFGASASPRSLTKNLSMSPSSTVDGGQHDAKCVTFELLLYAAFVADESWGVMLEPARSTHKWYQGRRTLDPLGAKPQAVQLEAAALALTLGALSRVHALEPRPCQLLSHLKSRVHRGKPTCYSQPARHGSKSSCRGALDKPGERTTLLHFLPLCWQFSCSRQCYWRPSSCSHGQSSSAR